MRILVTGGAGFIGSHLALEDALGARAILDQQPEQAGDVPLTATDTRHAEIVLGWRPRVTLEEGLARFVAWLRARP